jgi:predicted ATP-binding protein involved in virulence
MLRLDSITLTNFRCFAEASFHPEPDLTVLFAENAGGKTALLTAIAISVASWFQPAPLVLKRERDVRQQRSPNGLWEPTGECSLACSWTVAGKAVASTRSLESDALRTDNAGVKDFRKQAIEVMKTSRWPLIGFYGTQRLWAGVKNTTIKARQRNERWGGYTDCLDPRSTEGQLLAWLREEAFGDVQRAQSGATPRPFLKAVFDTIQRATPGVEQLRYDITLDEVRLVVNQQEVGWSQLSDGYHSFIAMVGDLARRAITLNDRDGEEAPQLAEGLVLIDEVDLHLHPRWQRHVLPSLCKAFPNVQFIVTTHSPQVLSSIENRQVRKLNGSIQEGLKVAGRDSNAILVGPMGVKERDEQGTRLLSQLYDALDQGDWEAAETQLKHLILTWGALDPEVIRAQEELRWAREAGQVDHAAG